ncbi:MAG: hypothetical protein Kow0091_25670 [Geminocystis sp.]
MTFPLYFPFSLTQFWNNSNLRKKLALSFGISTFLLSIIFSLVVSQSLKSHIQKEKIIFLQQISNELTNTFNRGLFERQHDIENMAILPQFRNPTNNNEDRRLFLEKLQNSYEYYAWIGFANTEGIVEVATGKLLEGEKVNERPWFIEGLKSIFIGDVHEAKLLARKLPPLPSGEPLRFLDVSIPVYSEQGSLTGVLGAHLSWNWIEDVEDSLVENIPNDQQIQILIIANDGLILFDSGNSWRGKTVTSPPEDAISTEFFNNNDYIISTQADKGNFLVNNLGWRIVVRQPKITAFKSIGILQQKILFWGLLLATIFSLIGWYFASYLTQPLLNLAYYADQIRRGDYEIVKCDRTLFANTKKHKYYNNYFEIQNEILLLYNSFEELIFTLIKKEKDLKNINKQLEEKVKIRTKDLHKAKEIAEKANQAKSIFLSSMSHELRTPLNAILGFCQLILEEENITKDTKENLQIIINSGEHLLSLINEVLEISKIEAGKMVLNNSTFNFYELASSLKSMLLIKATEKNINLLLEIDNNIPKFICADERKLKQILLNLISNSLKFTQAGSITIKAVLETENKIYFAVTDTGRGMKPEELEKLFTPFFQTESGIESKQGTGLGLTISRQFVKMMGGELKVKSQFNQGTTFEFTINFQSDSLPFHQKEAFNLRKIIGVKANTANYRILIVDDEDNNRLLLTKLLQPLGFSLKEAVNGKEAVEIWQDWQPHLIWMDIGMPVMDGFQATRAIRKKESMTESSHQTIIIALTAHAFMEEKGEILAVGCEEVVNKPFIKEIIFEKLQQFLKLEYIYNFSSVITPSVTNVDKSDTSEIKRKILVAEDNLVNQKLVVNLLNKLNYTVKIAKDGEEVIEILKKEDYDLIFMDIEMPKINGIKATEIIYQEFSHRQIPPIIAMSAHEDENIISVCKSVGMKDYICKPIKQDNLKLILEKYIGVKS